MSEDLTGRRIGHYRIDGVLGRGGMSVMYRATDVRLGRKVALKVMGENLTGDAEFRERFVDEARNTSAIDHANVVPLYDFGEVDGLLYIAMRLVDGADLANLIADGPLSPARTLTLLAQVAEALDMLHDRGLVHLDVKPANVLVTTRESAGEHVYLADFGLTRRGATGHRTRSGDFLGSPTYAAPEHLRGEPVDGRTDEYALACVLFACLTGRPPFQGQVPEVIAGHLTREVPPVTGLVMVPSAIDTVIRKGMAKEQAGRYPDCRSLMAAARSALAPIARPNMPPVIRGATPPHHSGPQPVPQLPQQQSRHQPGPPVQAMPHSGPQPVQQLPRQVNRQLPQQQPPQSPPGGYPVQQPPPGQHGMPAVSGEPVRLRPPTPAGVSAFTPERGALSRWGLPILVGTAAVVVIIVLIIALTG
ncbi:MAG TPA: serine/threonine-protein kinase [Pseudonocardiaceae bacterium]|nr:serine/threonine-protein kinase [Pseudonocardiaceae bacterium]